jgi:hypothetical protein
LLNSLSLKYYLGIIIFPLLIFGSEDRFPVCRDNEKVAYSSLLLNKQTDLKKIIWIPLRLIIWHKNNAMNCNNHPVQSCDELALWAKKKIAL